jgi:hypothetical protein
MAELRDPYASPPLKKDRVGPLVRFLVIAALLAGAGAVTYAVIQSPTRTAAVASSTGNGDQQLAQNSYSPPTQDTAAPAPAPAPAAPVRRAMPPRAAPPAPAEQQEPAPGPALNTPPAQPTPSPPDPLSTGE